jgi:hypothetical protein
MLIRFYKRRIKKLRKLAVQPDVDSGRLGERTVGDDGEVILGPAVIVTPENVNSFAF